jgi:hypothetical protein
LCHTITDTKTATYGWGILPPGGSAAWNSEAAHHYARIRAALEKEGEPMWNLDLMIAAQAVAAVLVTHDHIFLAREGVEDRGLEQGVASATSARSFALCSLRDVCHNP